MVLVFGSINIDLVTRVERFPGPGETVSGISFAIYPGGKGANQALASARAGAPTWLAGAVGRDAFAATALALVSEAAVDLAYVARVEQATGCATILVSATGENLIVSVPGANACGRSRHHSRRAAHPQFDGIAAARASRRCESGAGGAGTPQRVARRAQRIAVATAVARHAAFGRLLGRQRARSGCAGGGLWLATVAT